MSDTLTVTDNRTGKSYELPINDGAIRAMDLRQIKTSEEDFGLLSYDPAYKNTASCQSRITYIDGEKGILRYRGYPIEQLAEEASYLEVAQLLLNGELPSPAENAVFVDQVTRHTFVHENLAVNLLGDGRHMAGNRARGFDQHLLLFPAILGGNDRIAHLRGPDLHMTALSAVHGRHMLDILLAR